MLATPLEQVLDELKLDPLLHDRLEIEAATAGASTVQQLLEDGGLHRALHRHASPGQLLLLTQQLARWLVWGPMRTMTPGAVAAEPTVPIPDDLTVWAEERGLLYCIETALTDLPREVFKGTPYTPSRYLTVAGVFERFFANRPFGLAVRERIWGWLQAKAAEVDAARALGPTRPARPQDPALGEVFDRSSRGRARRSMRSFRLGRTTSRWLSSCTTSRCASSSK
jgi:hypothetical protein